MSQEPIMNERQRACQTWALLVFAASKHLPVTYGELSSATGLVANPQPLAYIQEYCLLENLPPLTALVVDNDGNPGSGLYAVEAQDVPKAQQVVFRHNWYTNPEKTPTDYTFQDARERWQALTSEKKDKFIKACRESVRTSDLPDDNSR